MRILALIVLSVLLTGCSKKPVADETLPTKTVGEISPQEPRFIFNGPDGFEWNAEHRIWHNETARTSVTLAHAVDTTFQSVVDDFTAENMLASGLQLNTKKMLDVDGRPTLLVIGDRLTAPYPQQFCTVAFGTEDGCAQITAIYPTNSSDQLKKQIETALVESRYEAPG